jgi:Polyketide cyclase / dehydrase and lipid transport
MKMISPGRAETRSISIAASPEAVLDVVGDARRLPEWAPRFARAVQPDGDDWLIDTGAGELRIRLRVARELGTVDILRPGGPPRGAFTRVVPNEAGSEYLFTLLFPAGTDEAAIAKQMATVEGELQTVRELSEA